MSTESAATVLPAARRHASIYRLIVATSIGNALEFYDLVVYGYFASTLSKLFFPTTDKTVSLLLTLGTFALSYLARPVGCVRAGLVQRPQGPQGIADAFHRHDDARDRHGRADARLRGDWRACAHRHLRVAAVAGLFGGRRVRQFDGFPHRACARAQRLHGELAVREPGRERAGCIGVRRGADEHADAGATRRLGLAHPVSVRHPDRSGGLVYPPACR